MPILTTDIASIKGVSTVEKLFAILVTLLISRQVLAGGYDPAKTGIQANTPYTIVNAPQAADFFGFGSQLHRMAIYFFKSAGSSVPCIAFPLDAASGGAAAEKTITFATNATSAGSYILRLGSYLVEDLITIGVAVGDTPDEVAAAVAAAVTGKPNLPFTAAAALGVVTLTAKTADLTSESLSVTANQKTDEGDLQPGGMTIVIANTTTGSGSSDLADLWAYIGSEQSPWNTNIVQPYIATTALDGGRNVIGNPTQQTGLYDSKDYRPGNIFTCDTDGGESALIAAIALGESRKNTDPANCRLAAPDYPELGYEISAYASGFLALNAMVRSSSGYTRLQMIELYGPLDPSQDWTTIAPSGSKAYDNRNSAVRAGITPIIYKDGVAKPGDVVTFWHPDDNQNAPFKYVVNQRKIWNCQNLTDIYLNGEDQLDRPIVASVAAVDQSEVAIDADTLQAGLAEVAGVFESFGWIYEAAFTIRNTTVTENASNPDRFDIVLPIITSGNNRVNAGEIQVDRNLQAVSLTLNA